MGFQPLRVEDFADIPRNRDLWNTLLDVSERAYELYIQKSAEESPPPFMNRNGDEAGPSKKQRTPRRPHRKWSREEREPIPSGKSKTHNKRKRNHPAADDGGPQPPPPLPETVKNAIREMAGGSCCSPSPKLLIQKRLCYTDVSKGHGRLSMPLRRLANLHFLTDDESSYLSQRAKEGTKNQTPKLDVPIIEPCLNQSDVTLRKWIMGKDNGSSSTSYVINGKWKDIFLRNELRQGMVVQVWAFRIDGSLCLALVAVEEE